MTVFDDPEGRAPDLARYETESEAREWVQSSGRASAYEDLRLLELANSDRLVDLGCGAGYHLAYASSICKKVHGVDISDAMIELAQEKCKTLGRTNVTLERASLDRFVGPNWTPTCAFSWGVFHYLTDLEKASTIAHLGRILPTGGRVLLMDLAYSCSVNELVVQKEAFIDDIFLRQGASVGKQARRALTHGHVPRVQLLIGFLEQTSFEPVAVESDPFGIWSNVLARRR